MTLMKQKEPKEPKRRIALIMNVLFYFCGLCIGGGIVRNLTLCYELGKDDTANFIWHILPESVTMLVMTICGLCIFLILRNVKKEEVFVYQNSSLIQTIGVLIALNGLFQVTLSWFTPEGVPTDTSYRIFVLLGVFIIFMGYLFKMGVRMSYSDVPIWEKYTLTIEEAAKYFRIGEKKLRKLVEENSDANWLIMNGNRVQIKRRQFEKVIDSLDVI